MTNTILPGGGGGVKTVAVCVGLGWKSNESIGGYCSNKPRQIIKKGTSSETSPASQKGGGEGCKSIRSSNANKTRFMAKPSQVSMIERTRSQGLAQPGVWGLGEKKTDGKNIPDRKALDHLREQQHIKFSTVSRFKEYRETTESGNSKNDDGTPELGNCGSEHHNPHELMSSVKERWVRPQFVHSGTPSSTR